MRKLKRQMARAAMTKAGYQKMNRKLPAAKGERAQSLFSQNRRRYC
jgi:hypothetical protein